MPQLRIATRSSPLALWQAQEVTRLLQAQDAALQITLVHIRTQGDRILDRGLSELGGKGVFVKELEQALFDGRADIAVHSMKDVPMELPSGLHVPVILPREDPRDAFVSVRYARLADLPAGAIVGTSSLRRKMQLRAHYPHLVFNDVRGNVGTRLQKLERGEYDALILAAAGLKRLDLNDKIRDYLGIDECLPAIGQAAIGIECRQDDTAIETLISALNHTETALCLRAERAFNLHLHGGCHFPIAAYAQLHADTQMLSLQGMLGDPDGQRRVAAQHSGPVNQAEQLGIVLAEYLLQQGGKSILDTFRAQNL